MDHVTEFDNMKSGRGAGREGGGRGEMKGERGNRLSWPIENLCVGEVWVGDGGQVLGFKPVAIVFI